MRTIRRLIEAKKIEREENGEAGFSLIELIIVVVILGILVAVAIPIFTNIQDRAAQNAVDAAAANGATAAATAFADPDGGIAPGDAAKSAGSGNISTTLAASSTSVSDVCVSASDGTKSGWAGPAVIKDASGVATGCP
ncbi:type IV pilin protein [Microbacterium sp. KHB019]|uniref:type IV pilin protein n=1 Tax=Microbacterium sp. KHB019 TaxID=3129770 RepID=UPI00307A0DFF